MSGNASKLVSAHEVRQALLDRREIALLDVRTEAAHATGHPLFASSAPRRSLESEIRDRVPRWSTSIVIVDADGGALAHEAAARLRGWGYGDVEVLEGGVAGWAAAGHELFVDVNAPSKAFGELVVEHRRTPMLSAPELASLLEEGADVAVVDVRRFDEFATKSIPTGVSLPGGELVHRLASVAPRPETLVVVNCAGRTRGIIGAQSLINAGVPNRVVALENGTIGWTLAGLDLDHGRNGRAGFAGADAQRDARDRARSLAHQVGVRHIDRAELEGLVAVETRTLYLLDVRDPDEYVAGHLAGFRNVPGGQLIQETEVVASVRGARLVLAGEDGTRADMTASWLAQMGWEVAVLEERSDAAGSRTEPGPGPVVTGSRPVVPAEERYRRPYEGNGVDAATMQAYLDWEYGLVAQLARDGTHHFWVW